MRIALALVLASLAISGCEEKKPRAVAEFMENEAALHGTLVRCEREPGSTDPAECNNARQAAERIAVIEERAMTKAREQAFERAREEYRGQLDRERELRRQAQAEAAAARLEALTGAGPESGEAEEQVPAGELERRDESD
jgi:hypothetical protein